MSYTEVMSGIPFIKLMMENYGDDRILNFK